MKRQANAQCYEDQGLVVKRLKCENTAATECRTITLPNEALLDVIHCVDFNTTMALLFSNARFHYLVLDNTSALACRRRLTLYFDSTALLLRVEDIAAQEILAEAPFHPGKPHSHVSALAKVAKEVGCHEVSRLVVDHGAWLELPVSRMFKASPPLRFVVALQLNCAVPWTAIINPTAVEIDRFLRRFASLKRLELDGIGAYRFDWSLLKKKSVLKLPELVLGGNCRLPPPRAEPRAVSCDDLMDFCLDFSQLHDGDAKRVEFGGFWRFPVSFVGVVIERLRSVQRTVTVQFRLLDNQMLFLPADFETVEAVEKDGNSLTHCKSSRSNISLYMDEASRRCTLTNDPNF